jgi:myo-inositol 2-dehydrogenase / D-chiro-inositol 1-dehydrogenase
VTEWWHGPRAPDKVRAMPAEPVHLLLIGAGRMGLTHLRAMRTSDVVQIEAVVDPSEESRNAASPVRGYAALDDALAAERRVDGVLIAAPSTLHRTIVTECAERRLPILCEKPCGVTAADADAAAEVARSNGVPLQVGYWRRFVPQLQALKRDVDAGRFGELLQISCWQWDAEPPGEEFRSSSGGIVVDMAVHELDLIRWLTGEELTPHTTVSSSEGDDPDAAASLLQLSGGAIAIISLGRHFPHGDCVWVEVMGTRDHARVDVLWGEQGNAVFLDALRVQCEEFAARIHVGGAQRVSGATAADARRTLELAEQLARR